MKMTLQTIMQKMASYVELVLSATETILGVGAIAGLFAVRKYLFCTIIKKREELKYYNYMTADGITAAVIF